MKSLRELHEDEQREAAWLGAKVRFERYERAVKQYNGAWTRFCIAIALGAVLLWLRLFLSQ